MSSEKSLALHLLNQSRRDAVELARRKHIIDRLGRRVANLRAKAETASGLITENAKLKSDMSLMDSEICRLRALGGPSMDAVERWNEKDIPF